MGKKVKPLKATPPANPAMDNVKDDFLNDIDKMQGEDTSKKVQGSTFDPFASFAEPEGEMIVSGSTFFNWRDDNDVPYIGRIFVGQFLQCHPDERPDALPGELLGYDLCLIMIVSNISSGRSS